MKLLRFAVIGTGFWSSYQIPAWQELEGVELIAVYNRTRSRAEEIAKKFDVPKVYDDVELLLKEEALDLVDIITDVDTHASFTKMAAGENVDVICQKPMAPSLEATQQMVQWCKEKAVQFLFMKTFAGRPLSVV